MAVRSVLVKLLGDPSQLDRTLDDEKVKLDAFSRDRTVRIMADPSDIGATFSKVSAALTALNMQAQQLKLSIDDSQAQGALDRALTKALLLRKALSGISMDVSGRGLMTGPQDMRVVESHAIADALAPVLRRALPAGSSAGGITETQKAVLGAISEAASGTILERTLSQSSKLSARTALSTVADFFDRFTGGPEGKQPGNAFSLRKAISDWFHTPGFSVLPPKTGVFAKPDANGQGGGPFGTLFSLLGNTPFLGPLIGNPYGLAGGAALLAALGPALGTVIGGGIIGAGGAGLLGYGLAHALGQSPFLTDKQNDLRKRVSAELRRIHTTFNAGVVRASQVFTGNFRSIGHVFGGDVVPITQALGGAFQFMSPGFRDIGRSLGFALGGPPAPPHILPRGLVSAREAGNIGARELQPGTFESAITSIGHAFGMFEKIFSPQIPGIVNAIAGGIKKLAEAFISHPEIMHVMSAMLAFFLKLPGYALDGLAWLVDKFGTEITKIQQAAHDIHAAFDVSRHETAVVFDGWRHDIAHWFDGVIGNLDSFRHGWATLWDQIWQTTVGDALRSMKADLRDLENWRHDIATHFDAIRHYISASWDATWNDVKTALVGSVKRDIALLEGWRHDIATNFDQIRHYVSASWDATWNDTIGRLIRGIHDVHNKLSAVPGDIRNIFRSAGSWLVNAGKDVLDGLWSGMKTVWNKLTGWISSLAGWIKAHKGPVSFDSQLLVPAGKALMSGLHLGMLTGFGPIGSFIAGLGTTIGGLIGHSLSGLFGSGGGKVSGSVVQWISAALAIAHKPPSWLAPLMVLVSKESGGNPFAVDPILVGNQHAEGLFQTLPSTFNAYSLGGSIFNPIANAVAGIRYLSSRYGSPYNIPGLLSGYYQGYASGGWITEPVMGMGLNTRNLYTFGERGPEYVNPHGGGGNCYNITVTVPPTANPRDVGQQIVFYIRKFEQGAGASWRK